MYWWGKPYKKINFWVTSHFNIQLPFVLFSSFLYIFLITFLPTFFLLSYLPTFLSSYLSFLLPSYLPSYIYMRSCLLHHLHLSYYLPSIFTSFPFSLLRDHVYWIDFLLWFDHHSPWVTKNGPNAEKYAVEKYVALKKYYISTPLHLHTVYLALFFHLTWSLYSSVYLLLISAVLSPQG